MRLNPYGSVTRRHALRLSSAALVPAAFSKNQEKKSPDTSSLSLKWPGVAGRPRARITDYENDPFILGVERQLRCTCGCNLDVHTCRTTDFSCTTSPAMHRQVIALLEDDKSAEEILEAFVAEYGEIVLMAPRKEGFNLAAYTVPGLAITAVGALMAWILSRRMRRAPESVPVASAGLGITDDEAASLEAELSRLEL